MATAKQENVNKIISAVGDDASKRSSFKDDPKGFIKSELGVEVPDNVSVVVHEDDANTVHVVLPPTADKKNNTGW